MDRKKEWLIVKIRKVPDLTLVKYNSGGMQGIDSMLEFHREFLRQWSRKGILTGVSLHLFYNYDPRRGNGSRMGVYIGFWGTPGALSNARQLIKSSSLFALYDIEILKDAYKEAWEELSDYEYEKCCMLSKKEILIEPSGMAEGESYYTIGDWEPNEEGRLQQFYRLMQAFNENLLLRIDVYPVDWSDRIKRAFKKPADRLKDRQNELKSLSSSMDYTIDSILKSYE